MAKSAKSKGGPDPIEPGSPAWHKRNACWMHNQLHGKTEVIRQFAEAIGTSPTVTDETTALTVEVQELCDKLREALKTRIDPTC